MISKLPKRLPTVADMLADLRANPAQVAKALGVSTSTVYRWTATNKAPRTAQLALYWCTRWGQSDVDTELWNRARTYEGFAACLTDEINRLSEQIAKMGSIGDYGSANDPGPHIGRRFGLDDADTFRAKPRHEHAAIDTGTRTPKVLHARR